MRGRPLTCALWVAGVVAIYLRAPSLLSAPRFWAEEGSVYFAYAYAHPWLDTLVTPHGLYLLLYTNLAAIVAARAVPLTSAPLVTTLCAFAVQALTLALILWSRSALWRSDTRKVVGCLIVLLTPISGELWLTTTNSQFYLSLVTFLILVDRVDGASRFRVHAYRVLLVLAGLTGPVSCFLAPLFLLKAWRERQREDRIHTGILLACTLVQLTVLWSLRHEPAVARRFAVVDVPTLASIVWTNTIVWPFGGLPLAQAFADVIFRACSGGRLPFVVLGLLLLCLEVLLLWCIAAPVETSARRALLGSYLLLTVLSIMAGTSSLPDKAALMQPGLGGRYFYVPTVLLLLLLLVNIQRDLFASARSLFCLALLAAALIWGARAYQPPPATGPDWPMEVRRWQEDAEYRLHIWPPGWSVSLKKQ